MILSQLLKPELFAKLSSRDIEKLSAIVDAELIRNDEVRKVLQTKVEEYVPSLKSTKK